MSIGEIFANSIDLAFINESEKYDVMQILRVLGLVYHIASQGVL